jgi:hypothetical protein
VYRFAKSVFDEREWESFVEESLLALIAIVSFLSIPVFNKRIIAHINVFVTYTLLCILVCECGIVDSTVVSRIVS